MWVTNNLGYDVTLSGVLLYKNSQQEVSSADAEKLLANDTYALMIENGNLISSNSQPEVNIQYYVRPLEGLITLNGFPSNPNGTPEVSPVEAFAIGKEEGESSETLEDNKTVSITENGTTVVEPSEDYDGMKKVTATVAVPVPVLEANKATTIDVSAYTEPIEVTPTQGKDAMEKNTITLTNIPSGGFEPFSQHIQDQDDYYLVILPPISTLEGVFDSNGDIVSAEDCYYSESGGTYQLRSPVELSSDLSIFSFFNIYGDPTIYIPYGVAAGSDIEGMGLYENNGAMILTEDTVAVEGKTYYKEGYFSSIFAFRTPNGVLYEASYDGSSISQRT